MLLYLLYQTIADLELPVCQCTFHDLVSCCRCSFSAFSSASHFSLPALSLDPGAEAGGGRCPEAWPSCGGTQYGEFFFFFFFRNCVSSMHCAVCSSSYCWRWWANWLCGCVFNLNRCWPQLWWQTCPSSPTSCPDYSRAPSKNRSFICENEHWL